jgi:hypothetical protein
LTTLLQAATFVGSTMMFEHKDARGRCSIVPLKGDAVWFEFEGWIAGAAWPQTEQILESTILRHGTILMVGNGWGWQSYEPTYRMAWTSWFLKRQRDVRGVHLLVRSPILRMGIQVVNLAIPIIRPYNDLKEFRTVVERVAPEARVYVNKIELARSMS